MDQNLLQMNQVRSEDELAVVNISSTEIGALSKEAAERILQMKDTDNIHQLMYVPIEKKADLNWLIQCVGQALEVEDNDSLHLNWLICSISLSFHFIRSIF